MPRLVLGVHRRGHIRRDRLLPVDGPSGYVVDVFCTVCPAVLRPQYVVEGSSKSSVSKQRRPPTNLIILCTSRVDRRVLCWCRQERSVGLDVGHPNGVCGSSMSDFRSRVGCDNWFLRFVPVSTMCPSCYRVFVVRSMGLSFIDVVSGRGVCGGRCGGVGRGNGIRGPYKCHVGDRILW